MKSVAVYNETIDNFGFPETLIREFQHWVVLLRPDQVTLGSLVLAAKSEATGLSELEPEAFTELATVTAQLEGTLKRVLNYDKINYLMLMMVDRHVHFHVFPRYATARNILGGSFADKHWPKPPVLKEKLDMQADQQQALAELLRSQWAS